MIRFIVIVLSILGAAFLFSRLFPALSHIAFVVAGFGITWLMLLSLGVGVAAYKVTK